MEKTATLTIRAPNGDCLESRVGTLAELDLFLAAQGYPLAIADLLDGETEDDDKQTYYLAT